MGWPSSLSGFKIGLIADPHISEESSVALTREAILSVMEDEPDMIVFTGDLVNLWKPGVEDLALEALEPMLDFCGPSLAVPGNHDYYGGDAALLEPLYAAVGTRLLRNQRWNCAGVNWVGVDSACEDRDDAIRALGGIDFREPVVIVWHEPDVVDTLPPCADLMLSGHSHGGQFVTPWGWPPMTPTLGKKYVRGFYPHAPVPLYVSRGVGTTG